MKAIASTQEHNGMRKSKSLFPELISPQCAAELLCVDSLESTNLMPADVCVLSQRGCL